MAESHSIVVYMRAGSVQRVAFCECCPTVSVEIRSYEHEGSESSSSADPMWPELMSDGKWRDHEGVYRAMVYEPNDA